MICSETDGVAELTTDTDRFTHRGSETRPPFRRIVVMWSGAEGDRTPDLVNAIHALSQLSYSPNLSEIARTICPISQLKSTR